MNYHIVNLICIQSVGDDRICIENQKEENLFSGSIVDKNSIIYGCKYANGVKKCSTFVLLAMQIANGVNEMEFECKSSINKYTYIPNIFKVNDKSSTFRYDGSSRAQI